MAQRRQKVVRFDESLPIFAALTQDLLGADSLSRHAFLRDATGRLTLILRGDIDKEVRAKLSKAAARELGAYVDGSTMAVCTPEELFNDALKNAEGDGEERIQHEKFSGFVRLIDHRIVGQDWSHPNFNPIADIAPIVVFYSCKGGVGRTTALAIASAALAERGLNILVIDLDIEAPGLGSILLDSDNAPDFGSLDYLVENGISGIDDQFKKSCVATSPLTRGRAIVDVVPAVGRTSSHHPQNVLAKLGRAFLDDPDGHGGAHRFQDQVRSLVRDLSTLRKYDAIFVDARAGLSEASASAVIGLGGDVLFFGEDSPQTIDAYSYLFAHLSRYAQDTTPEHDWRRKLRMVHSKAHRGTKQYQAFRERTSELFEKYLYEEAEMISGDAFNFDLDDESAPHFAWPINFDPDYTEFNPLKDPGKLQQEFFDKSFGPFIKRLQDLISPGTD